MKAICGYRNCKIEFEKTVPWNIFHTKECKFAEWGIRRAEKSKKEALKKANKIMKCFMLFFILHGCAPAYAHSIDMTDICKIESNCDDTKVGTHGEIGRYQITPICLKHFNEVNPWDRARGNPVTLENLKDPYISFEVANWYMNWLFDRCWTVKDTIIAWNWGIGNWRNWVSGIEIKSTYNYGIAKGDTKIEKMPPRADWLLPKTTQAYLKRYEEITKEELS